MCIRDRVERADFVKMHFLGRRSVNRAFHLAESRKQRLRARLAGRAQVRSVDERVNLGERPMRVRLGCHPAMRVMMMCSTDILAADLKFRRADSRALHTLGPD